ncbi:MAG: sodium-dependent transporter [Bacteroidota bacterium]
MGKFDFSKRDSFGSKFGVIAAAAGSAVGLGNIWRFPYVAGENGGAAFLIIYVLAIIIIGMPVMLSEFAIGRMAQRNAFGAFRKLAPGKPWYLIGVMGILGAFMILAFYSTVAGWTVEYLIQSVGNSFKGQSAAELEASFEAFKTSGTHPVIWQLIFMVLTAGIVVSGIKRGIEKYTKILMPVLLLIIIIMVIRSVTLPGSGEGLAFLFAPDFSKITAPVVLEALGQAFFSMSIGMGVLITYGSYIRKNDNIGNSAAAISGADTLIAILSGVAIFPAVFAFNIEPTAGPGLVFITLPSIFNSMPAGHFFAILFFVLLLIAALTSSISVLEVVVAYATEQLGWHRRKATLIAALTIAVVGVLCTMSQGPWDYLSAYDKNVFDWLDWISANLLLPLGGFLIVIFAGWFLSKKQVKDEITNQGTTSAVLFGAYLFIIRFIAPIAIGLVFLFGLGLL